MSAAHIAGLLLVLVGSKLYKVLDTLYIEDLLDGTPLRQRVIAGALILGGFAAAVLAVRFALRRGVRPRKVAVSCLVAVPMLMALAALREWLLDPAPLFQLRILQRAVIVVEVFRRDLAFLSMFAALVLLALRLPLMRRWALGVLYAVAWVAVVMSGLDDALYRTTGMMGNGTILRFWVAHFQNVGFIVQSQLDAWNLVLLVTPLAVLASSLYLLRRRPVAEAIGRVRISLVAPLVLVLLSAALAVPEPIQSVIYRYRRLAPQVHAKVVTDLVRYASRTLTSEPDPLAKTAPPLADSRGLRFVATPRTRRLNVLLVILESTRRRSVTPYNPAIANTPFLAGLAQRSLLVDQMYAVIPHTARAWTALLAGVPPVASGLSSLSEAAGTSASLASLPRLLREQGYRSAFFTPAHLKFENDAAAVRNRGFDAIYSDGDYDAAGFERTNYFGYEDRILFKPLLAWIDRTRGEKRPFFVTLMTLTGHHDYRVPSTFHEVAYPVSDKTLNRYLNALRYVDDLMRDLLGELDRRGLLDSTLVIIVGDHGQSFGEHGSLQHLGTLHEEVLQVPGLLFAPALWAEGRRIEGPRQQIDVLPTVADALGFDMVGGYLPGSSLLRDVPGDRTLFFGGSQENMYLAMRRGSLKYIYYFRESPIQVHNLAADPNELIDLGPSLSPAASDAIERELLRWRRRAVDLQLGSAP